MKNNNTELKKALQYYNIHMCPYIARHSEQLLYCYNNKKSLIDFDWWTHIENLLGKRISFEDYIWVDSKYDVDLQELSEDDVEEILKTLNRRIGDEQ